MTPFPAYAITHIFLNQNLNLPRVHFKNKGNYLVFWWKEIALGQLFIEPGKEIAEKEYLQELTAAIKPTISFYSKGSDSNDNTWIKALQDKRFEEFSVWMNNGFNSVTNLDVPAKVPVSVIVCTRNRAAYLNHCLQMLGKLSCVPEEIVVVDNASKDNSTKEVVEKFPGVKYIKEPRAGLDIARNTGILNSSFSIVAFVDDDVLVHPLWVYRTWETFQDSSIAAMTGLVIASKLDTEAQMIFERHWSFNRGYVDKVYNSDFFKKTLSQGPPVWEIGAGANMGFRKSIFEEVGLFDELLDVGAAGCNGDSEMWFRILSHGHSIHYNPRAIVHHEHRKDMEGLKKQIFSYMRGYTTAALIQQQQHQDAGYKRKIFKEFPVYYLQLIKRGFPKYPFRFQTLGAEITGVLSGLVFYYKNKKQ